MKTVAIRPATKNDIPEILKIDKEASLEYFVPFFSQYYSHYNFGRNATEFLLSEVKKDKERFTEYITPESPHSLWIAQDIEKNEIIGLITFVQIDTSIVELELLLLKKECRGRGIGKRLVLEPLKELDKINTCFLYCFKENKPTLKFYESLGFVNTGPGPSNRNFTNNVPYSETHYKLELQQ